MQALVSGANRGLGFEMTRQLLARGDRVVAACRHPGKALALTRLAGEHPGKLHVLPLDLADPRSIAELARQIGALDLDIDLLVNNAGVLVEARAFRRDRTRSRCATVSRSTPKGAFLLTQALNAHLADGAKIVNLSSTLGSIARTEFAVQPELCDQQGRAEHGDATACRSRLRERGIVVVSMSPGWVQHRHGRRRRAD